MSDELFQDELTEIRMLPDTPTRHGYVYVMYAEGTNRIKIGRTRDVESRRVDVQIHCPFPVMVLHAVYCQDAPALESLLHGMMEPYRVIGEWFAMPDNGTTCLSLLSMIYKHTTAATMRTPDAHAPRRQIWDRLPSLREQVLKHLAAHKTDTLTDMALALEYSGEKYSTFRTCVHRLWKEGRIGRRGRGTYFHLEEE